MQRPTLLEGVFIALGFSVLLGPLAVLVQMLVGSPLVWKAMVGIMTVMYLVYLLAQSGQRRGRLTVGLAALLVLGLVFVFNVPLSTMVLLSLTLIWGVRSFAYSRSVLAAALHGGLCLLGCGAARLLYERSGSLSLAVWGFFLLQAAFVFIPARLARQRAYRRALDPTTPPDHFGRAYQAAEEALSRLQVTRPG